MESKNFLIFNSNKIIKEGDEKYDGEGVFYCGKQYTNRNGCECGSCDGSCGVNGCACPECEYTYSYFLYSTNKINCNKCKQTLIKIKLKNLLLNNSFIKKNKKINSITCKICKKNCSYNYLQIFHCFQCNFSICSKCALNKLNEENKNENENENNYYKNINPFSIPSNIENKNKPNLKYSPENFGAIYCGKKYTSSGNCLCAGCDGSCGPDNGCPCPLCSSILGYNVYSKNNIENMKCGNDGNLLIKTNFIDFLNVTELHKVKKNFLCCRKKNFLCCRCKIKEFKNFFLFYLLL